jgi:4'-phosphopantetheinyl transferase
MFSKLIIDALSNLKLTSKMPLVITLATAAIPEVEWPQWTACLDDEELRRAQSFQFLSDRRAFVAAHALLRWSLSAFLGGEATAWRFEVTSFGKPFLVGSAADLRFNLSHCRSRVAIVLAYATDVGVDVEADERAVKLDFGIAEAYFSRQEAAALRAIADEKLRHLQFLRLWTMKEACVKAIGLGLSLRLDAFSIDTSRLIVRSALPACRQLGIAHWRLPGHQLAAATNCANSRHTFHLCSLDDQRLSP